MEQRGYDHLLFEGGGLVPPPERLRKVLVVGAGVAGLQVARQFLKLGVQVLVLETNDDVGGVWIRNYVNFGLQVPWRMYQFPEFPWPKDLQPSSEYPTGQEVQEYVRAYCRAYNLKNYIRFNCKLLRLRWCAGARQWDALYCDTAKEKFFKVTVDYAIICAGIYSQPYIPDYEGTDTYAGIQLHAKDFVDLSLARGRRVVIVGAGKTALDCVSSIVATNTATSVTLLYRQAHWPLPRRMVGTSVRRLLFNRAMTSMMPPYYTAGRSTHVADKATGPIKKLFWRSLEAVISRKFRITEQMRPRVHLPADLFYGGQILDNTMDKLVRSEALLTVKGEINRFVRNGVILQDGNFVAADLVLYCTGYLKTYEYLEGDMRSRLDLQKDGLYLYRNCMPHAVPHLAFIGSEVSTYNNILTHGLQALWLAHVLTGQLRLPPVPEMVEDIRAQQRWRRSIMPAQRSRGSVLMLYMMQYHDQLLEDMGERPRRKGINLVAECFGAYTAFDYRTVMDLDVSEMAGARRRAEEQLAAAGVPADVLAATAAGRTGPVTAAPAAAAVQGGGVIGGGGGSYGGAAVAGDGGGGGGGGGRASGNGMVGGGGGSATVATAAAIMRYAAPLEERYCTSSRAGTSMSVRSAYPDSDSVYSHAGYGGPAGGVGSGVMYGGGGGGGRMSGGGYLPAGSAATAAGAGHAGRRGSSRNSTSAGMTACSPCRISEPEYENAPTRGSSAQPGSPTLQLTRYHSVTTRSAARAGSSGGAASGVSTEPNGFGGPRVYAGADHLRRSIGPHRTRASADLTSSLGSSSFKRPDNDGPRHRALSHDVPLGAAAACATQSGASSHLASRPPSSRSAGPPRDAAALANGNGWAAAPLSPTSPSPAGGDSTAAGAVGGSAATAACRGFSARTGSPHDVTSGPAVVVVPSSPSRLSRHTGPSAPVPQARPLPPPSGSQCSVLQAQLDLAAEFQGAEHRQWCTASAELEAGAVQRPMGRMQKSASSCRSAPTHSDELSTPPVAKHPGAADSPCGPADSTSAYDTVGGGAEDGCCYEGCFYGSGGVAGMVPAFGSSGGMVVVPSAAVETWGSPPGQLSSSEVRHIALVGSNGQGLAEVVRPYSGSSGDADSSRSVSERVLGAPTAGSPRHQAFLSNGDGKQSRLERAGQAEQDVETGGRPSGVYSSEAEAANGPGGERYMKVADGAAGGGKGGYLTSPSVDANGGHSHGRNRSRRRLQCTSANSTNTHSHMGICVSTTTHSERSHRLSPSCSRSRSSAESQVSLPSGGSGVGTDRALSASGLALLKAQPLASPHQLSPLAALYENPAPVAAAHVSANGGSHPMKIPCPAAPQPQGPSQQRQQDNTHDDHTTPPSAAAELMWRVAARDGRHPSPWRTTSLSTNNAETAYGSPGSGASLSQWNPHQHTQQHHHQHNNAGQPGSPAGLTAASGVSATATIVAVRGSGGAGRAVLSRLAEEDPDGRGSAATTNETSAATGEVGSSISAAVAEDATLPVPLPQFEECFGSAFGGGGSSVDAMAADPTPVTTAGVAVAPETASMSPYNRGSLRPVSGAGSRAATSTLSRVISSNGLSRRLAGAGGADAAFTGAAGGPADSGSWQQMLHGVNSGGVYSTGSSGIFMNTNISLAAGVGASAGSVSVGAMGATVSAAGMSVGAEPPRGNPSPLSHSHAYTDTASVSCSLGNWVGHASAALGGGNSEGAAPPPQDVHSFIAGQGVHHADAGSCATAQPTERQSVESMADTSPFNSPKGLGY